MLPKRWSRLGFKIVLGVRVSKKGFSWAGSFQSVGLFLEKRQMKFGGWSKNGRVLLWGIGNTLDTFRGL